ncbi:dihydrofolate reductase family protein [Nocardioides taihuensis]|uniref:Dihydrofolate reductase family protein n=1 Tax=Nocardioides taihuensis TaxID=1835606 RepID=A0ABW0BMY1_9ACTN
MGKVLYYTACTLDGFIADEAGSLDWLFEVPSSGDDSSWEAFIGRVGALAMGATTYTWVVEHEALLDHPERWTEWYGDRPCWVFTHRDLPRIRGVDVRFVEGDVRPVHAEMDATGRDSWVVGGGDLVGQFDDAGLLDEIHLGMCPVTLGAGAPLLPRRITSERLTLRSVEQDGQRARLVLDVAR